MGALGPGHQVKRLLVDGAIPDREQVRLGSLQSPLQEGDDRRFSRGHGAHQDEDPLAGLRPIGARSEKPHQVVQDLLHAEDPVREDAVLHLVFVMEQFFEARDLLGPLLYDHIVDPAGGEL